MVHAGAWGPAGTLVPINVEDGEKNVHPPENRRRRGAPARPARMLVGVSQLGAADRESNILHGNCGVAVGTGLVWPSAVAGAKPHQPWPPRTGSTTRGT